MCEFNVHLSLKNTSLSRPTRQKLIQLPKAMKKGGPLGATKHMLKNIKKDFKLEFPAIANYSEINYNF